MERQPRAVVLNLDCTRITWSVKKKKKKKVPLLRRIKSECLGLRPRQAAIFVFLRTPLVTPSAVKAENHGPREDQITLRREERKKGWKLRKIISYGMAGNQEALKEQFYYCDNGEEPQKRSRGSLHGTLNVANHQKLKIHTNWRKSRTDTLSRITSGVIFRLSLAV